MSRNIPHDSAIKHVTGESVYVDDISVSKELLVGRVVYSPHAHARIKSFDLSAAKRVDGVHAILSYKDIPGHNQVGPIIPDEPCLAEDLVTCVGQGVFIIAAETEEQCRTAERLIEIEYEPLDAITDIETAIARNSLLGPPRTMRCGDVASALLSAPNVLKGTLTTGAQEHWYLESQVCLCIPGEGREIDVFSSSQNPSETQALVAEVLGIGKHDVVVEVRRMGGAFGGKETQANHTACWAALLCHATKRPVKIRLFRDDDMKMTGKRHRFLSHYEVGYDNDGTLIAAKIELNSDGGNATDLSFAIMERAMLHVDNSYFIPNFEVTARVWKTNLPSNTAFRGFGGPQGMAVIETAIDRIARALKKDPLEIRLKNFYGMDERNTTHYGQTVENNRLSLLQDQLSRSSNYQARKKAIDTFNKDHEFVKRGIAFTPVKFGISFTTSFLNQAGALVHVYKDGTILVNHGGTEMGQGLNIKMQQIAEAEFGVRLSRVKVNATNTAKVPNTSATAASSGTDLNGMAVRIAAETIKSRIAIAVAEIFSTQHPKVPSTPNAITFKDDMIFDSEHSDRKVSFVDAIPLVYLKQVSLSSTGFYKTPDIGWDKVKGFGKPFHYFAFGMAVTEVEVDVLTGYHSILRTDILHDVGESLNIGVDIGQIEGGFVQGNGWCTTEEIKWDAKGNLLTHSPDTYKIPAVRDIPKDFRVELLQGAPNPNTIRQSKAVGEPPFMLALSTWLAIKDAISAIGDHTFEPIYSLPATNEVILLSAEDIREKMSGSKIQEMTGSRFS